MKCWISHLLQTCIIFLGLINLLNKHDIIITKIINVSSKKYLLRMIAPLRNGQLSNISFQGVLKTSKMYKSWYRPLKILFPRIIRFNDIKGLNWLIIKKAFSYVYQFAGQLKIQSHQIIYHRRMILEWNHLLYFEKIQIILDAST